MLRRQPASDHARPAKQSQEEADRSMAELLHRQLNGEGLRKLPGGSTNLDDEEEEDLYADNSYHLYEDGPLEFKSDDTMPAFLQNEAIVPTGKLFPVDPAKDMAMAMELQLREINSACDAHLAKEISGKESNVQLDCKSDETLAAFLQNEAMVPGYKEFCVDKAKDMAMAKGLQLSEINLACDSDGPLAKEVSRQEIDVQILEDEKMARSLSQQQPTMPSGIPQQAMSGDLPGPLTHLVEGMSVLCNHCHQPRRRQRQRGAQRHWAGRGRQQRDEDIQEDGYEEDDNYEDLLELGERIGDAEGQGLNSQQIDMLPVSNYASNSTGDNQCKVCHCEFEAGETVRTLPCCHLFHRDCIDSWIKDHNSCPVCRKGIREELHQ